MKLGGGAGAERGEFERRLEEHRGIVFKLAHAWCPAVAEGAAGEDRDDLVQEICLQLWRAYPGYDPGRKFSTWMYRVALNTAISFARRARSRRRPLQPLESVPEAALRPVGAPAAEVTPETDDRLARLEHALRELPELDRALVLLHLDERSHREIAEILGLSESNVGTKLNRLKDRLRRMLTHASEENRHARR